MKLLLSCTELGLGHVGRLIPLGKKLAERGHELHFFSGGTAYELLKNEFENVYPCTPVAWYETAHGVLASASFLNILLPLPKFSHEKNRLEIKSSSSLETIHRYYDLRRPIRRINPDLLISDGDMHALRLALRSQIPSVYVTNIIRPSYSFSPLLIPGERLTETYVKACTQMIVPDNPNPYTICELNLGDINAMHVSSKVNYVGSFVDMTPTRGGEEHIFAPISGPLGTRSKLIQVVLPALQRLETKSVISLGQPGKRIVKKVGNCEIHSWLTSEERSNFMANSKLVVFSGGHATCFETIKHIKPSVVVPTQPEQTGNGKKLETLGCSILIKNRQQLVSAIKEIENNTKTYRRNVQKLNEFSNRFAGLNEAVKVIERALSSQC